MPSVLSKFYVSDFEKFCDDIYYKNNMEMKGYKFSCRSTYSLKELKYFYGVYEKEKKNGGYLNAIEQADEKNDLLINPPI